MQSPARARSVADELASDWGLGQVSDWRTLRVGSGNALFGLETAHRSVVVRRLAPESIDLTLRPQRRP